MIHQGVELLVRDGRGDGVVQLRVAGDLPAHVLDGADGGCRVDSGVVYADAAGPGHEVDGLVVQLSQSSYCSPTKGHRETTTGPDGSFEFEIYLHDTDGFTIRVEQEGYESASQSFGGFDCLFCSCPPFEIVLKSSDTL